MKDFSGENPFFSCTKQKVAPSPGCLLLYILASIIASASKYEAEHLVST